MYIAFFTWRPAQQKWLFREVLSPSSIAAFHKRKRKFRKTAKAFVKLPDHYLANLPSRKRNALVNHFYQYQISISKVTKSGL